MINELKSLGYPQYFILIIFLRSTSKLKIKIIDLLCSVQFSPLITINH